MMLVRGFPNRVERTHNASSTLLVRSPVSKGKKSEALRASHSVKKDSEQRIPIKQGSTVTRYGLPIRQYNLAPSYAVRHYPKFSDG